MENNCNPDPNIYWKSGGPLDAYIFSCSDGKCISDYSGKYTSMASCQADCQTPIKKYSCSNYKCVEDPQGTMTLDECRDRCVKPSKNILAYVFAAIGIFVIIVGVVFVIFIMRKRKMK